MTKHAQDAHSKVYMSINRSWESNSAKTGAAITLLKTSMPLHEVTVTIRNIGLVVSFCTINTNIQVFAIITATTMSQRARASSKIRSPSSVFICERTNTAHVTASRRMGIARFKSTRSAFSAKLQRPITITHMISATQSSGGPCVNAGVQIDTDLEAKEGCSTASPVARGDTGGAAACCWAGRLGLFGAWWLGLGGVCVGMVCALLSFMACSSISSTSPTRLNLRLIKIGSFFVSWGNL
mmetsp:Transcript_7656/g.14042  ORF Transcript_7656/g.14042 Transcript_7656/m.14042 type:complete len:239 (-) Transcript_7656:650-1366(-)